MTDEKNMVKPKIKDGIKVICYEDFIKDQDKEWIKENFEDLHHHAFNNDYYIIGTYQAKKWLGDEVFNVIDIIKQY